MEGRGRKRAPWRRSHRLGLFWEGVGQSSYRPRPLSTPAVAVAHWAGWGRGPGLTKRPGLGSSLFSIPPIEAEVC